MLVKYYTYLHLLSIRKQMTVTSKINMDSYSLKIDVGSENGTLLERIDHKVMAISSWSALDQGYEYVREKWGGLKHPSSLRISVRKLTSRSDKELPM